MAESNEQRPQLEEGEIDEIVSQLLPRMVSLFGVLAQKNVVDLSVDCVDQGGSVVVSRAALATTATDGFLYIPTCAGPPTGVPTAKTGTVPLVYDTVNNRLYVRRAGAWAFVAI